MFRIVIILMLMFGANAMGQNAEPQKIPRNTSYTLDSAFEKLRSHYLSIKPVRYNEADGCLKHKDIPYVSYGKRALVLDLFSPSKKGDASQPVVLLIHGGGWGSGDRTLMYPLADYLAKRVYTACAVEYRLSPEAKYPAAVNDINQAITWIRDHGREYGIDTHRIAILGCSAGAQLAGLLGLKYGTETDSHGKIQKRIHAIVNIDGIMDFSSQEARRWEDDPARKVTAAGTWFGGRYAEKKKLWDEASPVYYVTANAPPILFVNSSMPRFHVGRDEVIEQLNTYAIFSDVITFNDAPHTFWLFGRWFEKTGECVAGFLDRVFRKESEY
jgi:acetyl esterase/lipase